MLHCSNSKLAVSNSPDVCGWGPLSACPCCLGVEEYDVEQYKRIFHDFYFSRLDEPTRGSNFIKIWCILYNIIYPFHST